MNSLLFAVVRFFETVVDYSLVAVLGAAVVLGTVAVCREVLAMRANGHNGRATELRMGSSSVPLAAILATAFGGAVAVFTLWAW